MGAIAKTDVELVAASLRGEHEAFGHLVARYQDVVCAVSYSSTGDRSLSEDVAQETFVAAWSQLDRLRDSVRLRPWLCGIARNLARKARKRTRREEPTDGDDHVAAGNPFEDAARGDVARIVREALDRIPEGCREVLVLYYREDLSVREIADTLGTNEVAVMQRLSRGRKYLADSISDLVERSLRGERRKRDLVAAVLASIAALAIPSRVDASPLKGSTMMKTVLFGAAAAIAVVGTGAYLLTSRHHNTHADEIKSAALHFGGNAHGLSHAPALGPTLAPHDIASRKVAHSDLALLPADADAVIGLNFAQARESQLWKRFVAPQLAKNEGIKEFTALCGFDPLTSLGSVSLGFKGLGNDNGPPNGTIVIHGFEKTKAMTCFDQHGVADAEKVGVKFNISDGIVLITHDDQHAAFTFVDDTTAIVVFGPAAETKESVQRIAAGTGTLATSSTYAETLQYVNTDDTMWVMLGNTSPIIANMNQQIAKYTPTTLGGLYVAVNVNDNLAVDAGMRLGSPQAVDTMVSVVKAQLAAEPAHTMVQKFFDQLDVAADGSDLILSFALSGEQIEKLLDSGDGQVTVN